MLMATATNYTLPPSNLTNTPTFPPAPPPPNLTSSAPNRVS